MKHGKRYRKAAEEISARHLVGNLGEAVDMVKKFATAKFDETIEISAKLGVDPRHADQQVRGTVVLPHGTGRTVRVLVITKTPPAAILLKRAAGIATASGEPNRKKVGTVTRQQVREIAESKMPDLNANDVEMAMRIIEGTARSMGITVE